MLTACERRLLAFYLANAASRLRYRDYEASNLADWVADRANGVSTFGTTDQSSRVSDMDSDSEEGMSARKWRDLQRLVSAPGGLDLDVNRLLLDAAYAASRARPDPQTAFRTSRTPKVQVQP